MTLFSKRTLHLLCALLLGSLSSCSLLPKLPGAGDAAVIYALGAREGFKSPLEAPLKPICPALEFSMEDYRLNGAHRRDLSALALSLEKQKQRLLIVGYSPSGLPEDHARSLSERRAQAVRQFLIERGVDPAALQTLGFGQDSAPNAPNGSVVVLYQQP